MQDFEKNIQALKEMLAIHPKGMHFCTTNAEFLNELIMLYEKANELLILNCGSDLHTMIKWESENSQV